MGTTTTLAKLAEKAKLFNTCQVLGHLLSALLQGRETIGEEDFKLRLQEISGMISLMASYAYALEQTVAILPDEDVELAYQTVMGEVSEAVPSQTATLNKKLDDFDKAYFTKISEGCIVLPFDPEEVH